MSKGFSINDILGNGAKPAAPAGQKMQVVMLPAADIEPNPENSIYEIGDVSMLKADIAERGLRSPLEVLPAQGGKYMLLAGHRRWTACRALTAEGVTGFEVLPCVIHQSQGADDDLIALITSNATARELTDGERLRQYIALKQALERKKAAGGLDGRVRDEMSRITGDGTGTLGRLNAIASKCVPEVIAMVERGEITMTRAYECSKLYKVQQVTFAKNSYAPLPEVSNDAQKAAILYIVDEGVADQLRGLDYVQSCEWNYADGGKLDAQKMQPVTLDMTDNVANAILRIAPAGRTSFTVEQLDPADQNEVIAKSCIYSSRLYRTARSRYIDKKALEKYKAEEKEKKNAEKVRHDAAEKWLALARQELADFDNWKLTARHKDLGLTIRERKMFDGGRLIIAVDDTGRYDSPVNGFPYRECFSVRLGPDGERVGRDGERIALDWNKRWYSTGAGIEGYIADDIKRAARGK
ncbi:ParB/RepB/Spo0J family partition protein [uncultured Gemmiger sp.]|uniref:ParB/RepB/Spo0J family partition protein n=1 Tax=uncultured Gemmiger sp. TaxID=1623490 RepID=UPI0025D6D02C|nr:ParB/RepB/Spo0J family partition protein [uncultured Gemmiger sp.]